MAIEMQSVINGFLEGSIRTTGREPVINELIVSENGTYIAPSDIDGYNPVIVNVPKTPLNKLTVTENGTYTAPTDTGYDEVNVNVPLPSNAYLLKEIEDVDIASFSDGSNLPMPSLKVGIEPQQDLHGYDAPWVGGSGKNKLGKLLTTSGSLSGVTYTANSNGTFTVNGKNSGSGILDYRLSGTGEYRLDLPVGDYYLNGGVSGLNGTGNTLYIAIESNGTTRYVGTNNQGTGSAFSIAEGEYISSVFIRLASGVTANNAIFKPMIRLASVTDATYAPYSNICPISGHTEVNVVVSPTTDAEDGTTYNIQFKDGDNPLTVYGGSIDVVSGELKVVPYYASYNGETLEGEWISDRDVYAVGTTPTIGAQVVNTGATPQVIQLTPTQIKTLLGNNVITADTGSINNIEYFAKE